MRSRWSNWNCCEPARGYVRVIASEAKQSSLSLCREVDCFATLAMTVKYQSTTTTAVIPRACGGSSTPRLIGSIIDVSGILDRPPSRTMTGECVSAFSRRAAPEFCMSRVSQTEGAGNAGCLLHPRSRVQTVRIKTHTSIQVQSEHSGIPCAMALRLMP